MAGKGGAIPGAGRKPGSPNKVTQTLREKARKHTDMALGVLVKLANDADSDAVRLSAASAIIDRGYGKPSSVLSGDEDGGAIQVAGRIELVGVRPS